MLVGEDMAFLRSYHAARANIAWADATEDERRAAGEAALAALDADYPRGVFLSDEPTEALFAFADAALADLMGDKPEVSEEADAPAPKRRGRPRKVEAE